MFSIEPLKRNDVGLIIYASAYNDEIDQWTPIISQMTRI